jgi:hypothetical protein
VEDFEKEEQEEVTSGVYAIRGIVYLEGKHHEVRTLFFCHLFTLISNPMSRKNW